MNKVEVAVALYEIPAFLRANTNISLAGRYHEILSGASGSITEADLIPILSTYPALIDSWSAYVEDQRTSDGWYVTNERAADGATQWILACFSRRPRVAFTSPAEAYAAFNTADRRTESH